MSRALVLGLTIASGFAALVYEVAWQKYLAILVGSHSEATAAVLGIFLGGLAVGYWSFGRLTERLLQRSLRRPDRRPPRLVLLYAAIEAGLGLHALAFPLLFELARACSIRIPTGIPGVAFAFDLVLCGLLIGPPAWLMGGTLPVLTQALPRRIEQATRLHALLYGFNAAGAFAGGLLGGFVLIPRLGLVGTSLAMGGVNLSIGAIALALGRNWGAATSAERSHRSAEQAPAPAGFRHYAAAACLAGFAMMSLQTALIRLTGLSLGASHFAFAMLVSVFVLCIAVGSLAVSAFPRVRSVHLLVVQWSLALSLLALYPLLPDAPYWAHRLRIVFRDDALALAPYHASVLAGLTALLFLPLSLSGASLPLLFHHLRRELDDLGTSAGRLYGWNTLGSLLGAMLGGFALLYWLDLHQVYRIAVAALVGAAGILTLRLSPRRRARLLLAAPAALLLVLALLPPWNPRVLAAGLFRVRAPIAASVLGPQAFYERYFQDDRVIFHRDDPAASIAVLEIRHPGEGPARALIVNGKSDGNLPVEYLTTGLLGVLPALLADEPGRAFVVGWGTGVTAAELAALDTMREVVVAEISPAVIEAAPLFDAFNGDASKNSKIKVVQGDAYRSLLRSEGLYDVIASEPSNPWVSGVEMLYSRDFLEAARKRLAPGGVYAQWFHFYESDDALVALVLATFDSVFESSAVWYANHADFFVLGFQNPRSALDVDRLAARLAQPDFAAALRRLQIQGLPALLAHEAIPLGVIHAAPLPDEIHTLLRPRLADRAARAFFRGGYARLPDTFAAGAASIGARNSLVARLAERFGGKLPEEALAQVARETCRFRARECPTWIAHWAHAYPRSPRLVDFMQRARDEPGAPRFDPELVPRLATLVAPGVSEIAEIVRPEEAAAATELYKSHYHHAAPFSRDALLELWTRCREEQGAPGRCARGLARAANEIGVVSARSLREGGARGTAATLARSESAR